MKNISSSGGSRGFDKFYGLFPDQRERTKAVSAYATTVVVRPRITEANKIRVPGAVLTGSGKTARPLPLDNPIALPVDAMRS